MAKNTEHVERTDSGHQIRMYEYGDAQTAVGFQFQVPERCSGITYASTSIQEAREIHAALGKALRWHDAQQHAKETRANWLQIFGNDDNKKNLCPRCGERLNPDEGGFCEGCFQNHPMQGR